MRGHLIAGVSLVALGLLVMAGFVVQVSTGLFTPAPPPSLGPGPTDPEDGADGNVVVTLGKGPQVRAPDAPLFPDLNDEEVRERTFTWRDHARARENGGYLSHTIERGETLSALARRYLGRERLWPLIVEHNTNVILDPGHLRPGTEIRIPVWLREDY